MNPNDSRAALQSDKHVTNSDPHLMCDNHDRSQPCLSLRALTVTVCAVLIGVTAGASLGITLNFSFTAAVDVAEEYAQTLSSKALADVVAYIRTPVDDIAGLQYVMYANSSHYPLPNATEPTDPLWYVTWWDRFLAMMHASGQKYLFAVVGFNDGNYAGCKIPQPDQTQCRLFSWSTRAATGRSARYQETYDMTTGGLIENSTGTTSYDPRTRGWYSMVNHTPFAMQWSDVYLSGTPTAPILDINGALVNASGSLIGIFSATFALDTLSEVTQRTKTTPNTRIALVDNDDLLLASSYETPYLTETEIPKNYTEPIPSNCIKSDTANDAARSLLVCRDGILTYPWPELQKLAADYPELVAPGAETGGIRRVKLGDEWYFVSIARVQTELSAGMRWRHIVIMPELDVTSDIVSGRDTAIGVVVAVMVFACFLCFIVVTKMLTPLKTLQHRMARTAQLQDTDDGDAQLSRLSELYAIQVAYVDMKNELEKIKSFLPANLFAALYGGDSDFEEEDEGSLTRVEVLSGSSSQPTVSSRQSSSHKGSFRRPSRKNSSGSHSQARSIRTESDSSTNPAVVSAAKPLNTALGLTKRKVTVLSVNICDFHELVKNAMPDVVIRIHSHIASAMVAAAKEYKGVVDGFHGDRFTVTFNAVTAAASHAKKAVDTACALRAALIESDRTETKLGGLTCGMASGEASVGNLGTASMRRFCVIGPVFNHALLMERLCKKYAHPREGALLACGAAVADCEQSFQMQYLDVIEVPTHLRNEVRRVKVACLKEPLSAKDDEWMYQLQNVSAANPFAFHNEAFEFFTSGDLDDAREAMVKHDRSDVVAGHAFTGSETAATDHLRDLIEYCDNAMEYANDLHDFYPICFNGAPTSSLL